MKYVYHGSLIPNLKIIKKNKNSRNQNWVYGTYLKEVALIFINNKGNDLYYYLAGSGTEDDPIVLVERKKDMFKKIFNISGTIYKLSAKNFLKNVTGWSAEVISNYDEEVIAEEKIENVYEELKTLAFQNKIKLYLYPNRPKNIPLDNSDLIKKVKNWQKFGFDTEIFFNLYPELKDKFYQETS